MVFFDSKVNFIGSVLFEGNYAIYRGGKGSLKALFQQYVEREPKSQHHFRYTFLHRR